MLLEHPGLARRRERVVRDRIPGPEHEIVERGQRHELLDERRAIFRALA